MYTGSSTNAVLRLQTTRRKAFTLIELLVAITVLLILGTLTFTMVNVTMKGDQIRGAARQVQSFIEGARDRAAHAKSPIGVRFIRDVTDPTMVSSLIYIGLTPVFDEGKLTIVDNTSDPRHLRYFNDADPACRDTLEGWAELYERGLLRSGARIRFGTELVTYTVDFDLDSNGVPLRTSWRLTKPHTVPQTPRQDTNPGPDGTDDRLQGLPYSLELAPAVLPNQEPRLLPKGVVIDLGHSRLPTAWNSGELDVLFSPTGTMTGPAAAAGQVHLVLADARDVMSGRGLTTSSGGIEDNNVAEHRIVTITTKTGRIATHPVYFGSPADPFRFAELGEEAK